MTEIEFRKKFVGAIAPDYRGAPYPEFDPAGINESKFSDELRFKGWDIKFVIDADGSIVKVKLLWESQSWDEAGAAGFVAEVKRCFSFIGYKGDVHVHLYDRDGESELDDEFTL